MEILECKGKHIKICKSSITVKNEEWKTCGVVTNIKHLHDLSTREMSDYYPILRKSGLWCNSKIDRNNIIFLRGKIYLFRNMHDLETFRKCEPELMRKRDEMYAEAKKNGVEVIEAIIL